MIRRWYICLCAIAVLLACQAGIIEAANPIEIKFYCGETSVSSIDLCKGSAVTVTVDISDCDLNRSEECCYEELDISGWDQRCGSPIREQSGQYEGHYRASCVITCGDQDQQLTVTADDVATCSEGGSRFEDDPEASATLTIHCVELSGITILENSAADITGQQTPEHTKACAAVKGGGYEGYVFLEVGGGCSECVGCDITWTGGEAVTDQPRQRKISTSSWRKETVTATCGNTSATMLVYIVGAEPTGFSPQDGQRGAHFAKNERHFWDETGVFPPNAATGQFYSICEIEFAVRPFELVSDGNNGLVDKQKVQWDVTREKSIRNWHRAYGSWYNSPNQPLWTDDDGLDDNEEDNDPWNGDGYLYGNDKPGHTPLPDWDTSVMKANMREWVRVGLGGLTGRSGAKCSEYKLWRTFRAIRLSNGAWENDPTYENEIPPGNTFWGGLPITPDVGELRGYVNDSQLNRLEDATVSVSGGGSDTTDNQGYYSILGVSAAALHVVTASKEGFQTEVRPNVIIEAGPYGSNWEFFWLNANP